MTLRVVGLSYSREGTRSSCESTQWSAGGYDRHSSTLRKQCERKTNRGRLHDSTIFREVSNRPPRGPQQLTNLFQAGLAKNRIISAAKTKDDCWLLVFWRLYCITAADYWHHHLWILAPTAKSLAHCTYYRRSVHGTFRFEEFWKRDEGVGIFLTLVQWGKHNWTERLM